MNRPIEPSGLAETASKSTEQSVREEREAVGDHPDEGDLVTPDHAQSAPSSE